MKTEKQEFGKMGEKLAGEFLVKSGYRMIKTHYTTRWGEVDLIVKDGEEWVFVEVKTRSNLKYGFPEEAITPKKVKRLINTVNCYLQGNDLFDKKYRIDIILITFKSYKKTMEIRHIKNIFPFQFWINNKL